MKTILNRLSLSHLDEQLELSRIVSLLSDNPIIVEIGTFMGGSAAVMANANPLANIYCFDLFEDDQHKNYRGPGQYKLFDCLIGKPHAERSIDNVKKILKDYPNIHLNKLRSPDQVIWNTPVDFYFEDGIHQNPVLEMNLNFWSKFVKVNGYIAMHDHRPWLPIDHYHRFVDVEQSLDKFLSNGYRLISKINSLAVIQKIF